MCTRNVDDLHERAGSVGVLHLHCSLHSPRCAVFSRAHTLPLGIPDEPDGNGAWMKTLARLRGLGGAGAHDEIVSSVHNPAVVAQYQQFERRRGYEIKD